MIYFPNSGSVGRRPWQVLSCGCGVEDRHTEVRSVPGVFTERSEVPLVTFNLCVMRRYNLGERDLVSTGDQVTAAPISVSFFCVFRV